MSYGIILALRPTGIGRASTNVAVGCIVAGPPGEPAPASYASRKGAGPAGASRAAILTDGSLFSDNFDVRAARPPAQPLYPEQKREQLVNEAADLCSCSYACFSWGRCYGGRWRGQRRCRR